MREFEALVLYHYDFIDKKNGKPRQGTKYLVSLGQFGNVDANGPLDKSLSELDVVKVELTYKDNKFRVINVIK